MTINDRITPRRGRGRPTEGKARKRKTYPAIKCKNCRVSFAPIRKDQKFHSDACRKEFHQYGKMSIAKMAERIERILKKTFGDRITKLENLTEQLSAYLSEPDPEDRDIPF